jgi:hypothetical protein
MIERKIVIGCIVSTEYLRQVRNIWDPQLLETIIAKRLTTWCWQYFDKYDKAPGKDIETIFYSKLKGSKISKDLAEEIEEDILPGLSKEYEQETFNLDYLLEETQKYFQERRLLTLSENIESLLSSGELMEAEKIACEYKPILSGVKEDLDLSNPIALDRVDKAFTTVNECLIKYPRQLGEFWNSQLVRGGFVALMASEKRGKTFWLLDMALRACKQGRNVAFFQAGDMTEAQQLIRMCIYLAKKSNLERYSGKMWEPIRDCIKNQLNDCNKEERICSFGVFEGKTEEDVRDKITQGELEQAEQENKEYKPCTNCREYWSNPWGAVWTKSINTGVPLSANKAKIIISKFFLLSKRKFKLSSHANGMLSVKQMRALLAVWEKQEDFIPDVIIIDYADLLSGETKEFRHLQNEIWKGLRCMSQEKGQPLVITATQADARSYEQDRLKLSNFSEDKRKYAHVTAMYGLNQDVKQREKKIGIMRINEIVVREGDFSSGREITILQNLKRGRPFIGSYF